MPDLTQAVIVAPSRERAEPLAAELAACARAPSWIWAGDAERCRAALEGGLRDVVLSAGVPDATVAEAVATSGDGAPLVVLAERVDDALRASATAIGAAVVRLGADRAALGELLARAAGRRDARARRRGERAFAAGQIAVLEDVAAGAPLADSLTAIIRLIEAGSDGLCSILLVDAATGRVRHAAAPSLPPEYLRLIDGSAIGPCAGSCGTAAHRRERVVVEDIAIDPLWVDYRAFAQPFGLRACWSSPIFSSTREVLGTFAVYYRVPRRPHADELRLVDDATHLAALAIQRERNESALRRGEARWRQIVDTTLEGVLAFDLAGAIRFANRRAGELLRADPAELLGRNVVEIVDASEAATVASLIERRRSGISDQVELRLRARNGSGAWVILAVSPTRDETGQVSGMLGMLTDITGRREAESALARSEAQLQAMFDGSAIGMALLDQSMRLVKANPALGGLLGYAGDELAHATLLELAHADDLSELVARIGEVAAGDRASFRSERRFRRKDGGYAWARLTFSLIRRPDASWPYAVAVIEDVSEAKRLEAELRRAEWLRALIFDTVGDVLFYIGCEEGGRFRFLSVNEAFLAATGLRRDQVINKPVDAVIPEPSLDVVLGRYRQAIAERRTVRWDEATEYPAGRKYGEVAVTPLFDVDGRCNGLVGSVHDITARKLAEDRIAAQAALLDQAHDAIMLRALDGEIRYWNRGAERLYGYTAAEAVGRDVRDLLYGERSEAYQAAKVAVVRDGRWSGELEQRAKDGRTLTIEGSWTLFRDSDGTPQTVLAINTDISEQKRLRAEVAATQRMESLGTMAGGIAHDFNNLLTAILGSLQLAELALPPGHAARRNLDVAMTACGRAEDLVKRIMTFSRRREPKREVVDPRAVVGEALELLRSMLPAMIEVRTVWDHDVPPVLADSSQIHQVIMNLGTNAAHAMPGGGTLTVRLEGVELDPKRDALVHGLLAGRYVRLTVEDTGHGMDERTAARIFEPFFTTKPSGRGTGLGLSVVHGIVRDHGGDIVVRSAPGAGARFVIHLPAAAPMPAVAEAQAPATAARGRGERILYVDDDATILALGGQILEGFGYRVAGFTDPHDALAAFRGAPQQFDAVLTDYAMPSINGVELTRAILAQRPDLPVLLTTGFLDAEGERAATAAGVREILRKPDSVYGMVRTLDRLFASRRSSAGPT